MSQIKDPKVLGGLLFAFAVLAVLGSQFSRLAKPSEPAPSTEKSLASMTDKVVESLKIPDLDRDPFVAKDAEIIPSTSNPGSMPNPPMTASPSQTPKPNFPNSKPAPSNPQIQPFDPREINGNLPTTQNISPLPDDPTLNSSNSQSQPTGEMALPSQSGPNPMPMDPNMMSNNPTLTPPSVPVDPNSIRLTAIIIGDSPTAYIALGGHSAQPFKVGDEIRSGYFVKKVTSNNVMLQKGSKSAILTVGKDGVLP
jgi:hypothetical protein